MDKIQDFFKAVPPGSGWLAVLFLVLGGVVSNYFELQGVSEVSHQHTRPAVIESLLNRIVVLEKRQGDLYDLNITCVKTLATISTQLKFLRGDVDKIIEK